MKTCFAYAQNSSLCDTANDSANSTSQSPTMRDSQIQLPIESSTAYYHMSINSVLYPPLLCLTLVSMYCDDNVTAQTIQVGRQRDTIKDKSAEQKYTQSCIIVMHIRMNSHYMIVDVEKM